MKGARKIHTIVPVRKPRPHDTARHRMTEKQQQGSTEKSIRQPIQGIAPNTIQSQMPRVAIDRSPHLLCLSASVLITRYGARVVTPSNNHTKNDNKKLKTKMKIPIKKRRGGFEERPPGGAERQRRGRGGRVRQRAVRHVSPLRRAQGLEVRRADVQLHRRRRGGKAMKAVSKTNTGRVCRKKNNWPGRKSVDWERGGRSRVVVCRSPSFVIRPSIFLIISVFFPFSRLSTGFVPIAQSRDTPVLAIVVAARLSVLFHSTQAYQVCDRIDGSTVTYGWLRFTIRHQRSMPPPPPFVFSSWTPWMRSTLCKTCWFLLITSYETLVATSPLHPPPPLPNTSVCNGRRVSRSFGRYSR